MRSVRDGEARILVGTQMVTKGHHFPGIALAVVLNADQGLFSTDFRAAERLAQTIVQVAGRAGREHARGEVLIQTEYPDHPLLQSLLAGGYEGFAAEGLREREAARWPPFGRLALLRASALLGAMRRSDSCRQRAPRRRRQPGCGCSDRCPPAWRAAPDATTRSCCSRAAIAARCTGCSINGCRTSPRCRRRAARALRARCRPARHPVDSRGPHSCRFSGRQRSLS